MVQHIDVQCRTENCAAMQQTVVYYSAVNVWVRTYLPSMKQSQSLLQLPDAQRHPATLCVQLLSQAQNLRSIDRVEIEIETGTGIGIGMGIGIGKGMGVKMSPVR